MSLLIAVKSCNQHRLSGYNQAIRQTWGKQVQPLAELLFFQGVPFGDQTLAQELDERFLLVKDGYDDLPKKTVAILDFFLDTTYDHIFLCDTDTFIHVPTLVKSGYENYDIAGRYGNTFRIGSTRSITDDRGNRLLNCHPWPSGGVGYFLSRKAAQIVIDIPITHWAEDVHVGQATGPWIISGDLKACDLQDFETFASWHFQRRQYNNQVYDLKFKWMEKMYRENY
jgi:hypothetical protein